MRDDPCQYLIDVFLKATENKVDLENQFSKLLGFGEVDENGEIKSNPLSKEILVQSRELQKKIDKANEEWHRSSMDLLDCRKKLGK